MSLNNNKVIITGGAGFIGSACVYHALNQGLEVVVIDKLTYAGDKLRLAKVIKRIKFYRVALEDEAKLASIIKKEKAAYILNAAAHTHVDRSIEDPLQVITNNITATASLLNAIRAHGVKHLLHISTDEVYGAKIKGESKPHDQLIPSSPYSASKASADLLVQSFIHTYGLTASIVRPCNNYGPWQYPEKLIPVIIRRALANKSVPIYGNGQQMREWMHVNDTADALMNLLFKANKGTINHLGSGERIHNIKIAKHILTILKKPLSLIEHVTDRLGHDVRYAIDSRATYQQLKWRPAITLEDGLAMTVRWYIEHDQWVKAK